MPHTYFNLLSFIRLSNILNSVQITLSFLFKTVPQAIINTAIIEACDYSLMTASYCVLHFKFFSSMEATYRNSFFKRWARSNHNDTYKTKRSSLTLVE